MIRKKIFLKGISIFFILEIVFNTIYPSLSYALTSGPTAPEATSFEPVDTTDMVNLLTGDLAYNIPMLEVPGPSGGYPLSLSYHAGIQPGEEASWVGLGWTLNPGAITRNVNGYADDFDGAQNTDRFFWEGGERTTRKVGITVGLGNSPASVSAGLSFSNDTYQGYGTGFYAGGSLGGSSSNPVGVSFQAGTNPYGGTYSYASIGYGKSYSLSTDFKSISTNVRLAHLGPLEYSISGTSEGIKSSFSVGGFRKNTHNSKTGKMSSKSSGFDVNIPVYPNLAINLAYNHQRYWIDETEKVRTFGSLNNPSTIPSKEFLDNNAFDTYTLFETYNVNGNAEVNSSGFVDTKRLMKSNPENDLGGSFADYDNYSVQAQGVGGNIKPYNFQTHLYRQNVKEVKTLDGEDYTFYTEAHYPTGKNLQKPQFRFINDFSNRYDFSPSNFKGNGDTSDPLTFDFGDSDNPVTGESGDDGIKNNHLAGSRHIEYLSNLDIHNKTEKLQAIGFVDTKSSGFKRDINNLIGAFVITNESGVKYHFALPAYSYDEYQYSETIDDSDGETFNEIKKPSKYAYTWYLTAITGPDFVDRGEEGVLDEEDWGYWVEFDYGQWTDKYLWRNPGEGFRKDLDNNFQNYTSGKKELYYLDAIKTKSHTALFIKEIRNDSKSVAVQSKKGGFNPDIYLGYDCHLNLPTSVLGLKEILLLKNSQLDDLDYDQLKKDGGELNFQFNYTCDLSEGCSFPNVCVGTKTKTFQAAHYGDNVLDVSDLSQNQELVDKTIRGIEFKTDYSLLPETSNSFNNELLYSDNPSIVNYGKLTLKSLDFKGKKNVSLTPPINFNYDLEDPETGDVELIQDDNSGEFKFENQGSQLTAGDLLKFDDGEIEYYGVITKVNQSYIFIKQIGSNGFSENSQIHYIQTKNPPFNSEQYDIWGMYKSDFDKSYFEENEILGRAVTNLSRKSVDAWSLRDVQLPTGAKIKIKYESDDYNDIALSPPMALSIKKMRYLGGNQIEVSFHEDIDLNNYFDSNDKINLSVLAYNRYINKDGFKFLGDQPNCLGVDQTQTCSPFIRDESLIPLGRMASIGSIVKEVKSGKLTIEDASFVKILNGTKKVNRYSGAICSYYENGAGKQNCWPEKIFPIELTFTGWPDLIAGGYSSVSKNVIRYGGGLRISSIGIEAGDELQETIYNYEGGTTSYEPFGMLKGKLTDDFPKAELDEKQQRVAKAQVQKTGYAIYHDLMAIAREVPAPGVLYKNVTVKNKVTNKGLSAFRPSRTIYEFETFDVGMVGIKELPNGTMSKLGTSDGQGQFNDIEYISKELRKIAIKDYTSRLGDLKSVSVYSGEELIAETKNHYLYDLVDPNDLEKDNLDLDNRFEANFMQYEALVKEMFNDQGVIDETFVDARLVNETYMSTSYSGYIGLYRLLGIISKKERFPAIKIGQTTKNYKTGLTSTSTNLAFDFYSGAATQVLSKDSYGNNYLAKSIPAYKKYNSMGLAIYGGKNMLTQTSASFDFKVNDDFKENPTEDNIIKLMSASAQTWSDESKVVNGNEGKQNDVWRKKASFEWVGEDGIENKDGFDYSNFSAFDAWDGGNPTSEMWRKVSELTLFDTYSHVLEVRDINGLYSASKMDPNHEFVIATVSNSSYNEMAYSGAEYTSGNTMLEGGVSNEDGFPSTVRAHTGSYSLQVPYNDNGFTYVLNENNADLNKKYFASVWVYLPGKSETEDEIKKAQLYFTANGVEHEVHPQIQKNKSKSWYLLNLEIDPDGADEVIIGCRNNTSRNAYFDDFRVHPLQANMTNYVYNNENGELNYIIDANNFYTRFEYDAMGRLVRTSRELLNYDFGEGKESYRPDKILNETIYNYGKGNE